MSNLGFKIAIPSYKRSNKICNSTLSTLLKYKIPLKQVDVFVANEQQYKEYKEIFDKELGKNQPKLIIAQKGLRAVRNFMAKYYKQGEKIVYFDDDISDIVEAYLPSGEKNKLKQKHRPIKDLKKEINNMFIITKKLGARCFGVYPVTTNAGFMTAKNKSNNHIKTGLKFLIGFMRGCINDHYAEHRFSSVKEDYEVSCRYYLLDGNVVRFDNLTTKTKVYKESGGLQSDDLRNKDRELRGAQFLINGYPDLVHPKKNLKVGYSEVRLSDKRDKKDFGENILQNIDKHIVKNKLVQKFKIDKDS